MARALTNHDFTGVADSGAVDHNRYHGDLAPEPLEGGEFIHLAGRRAWSMVDAYRTLALGEPCTVCGHVRGGEPIRRSPRRRGLVHCLQCNAASIDSNPGVQLHGEPIGSRYNPGWEPKAETPKGEPPLRRAAKFRPRGAGAA